MKHDLQDMAYWKRKGFAEKIVFMNEVAKPVYGLDLTWHPSLNKKKKHPMDFKTSNGLDVVMHRVTTPFFLSGKYGCDPNMTVTLNHKDYIQYRFSHPEWGEDMSILFWVSWKKQNNYGTDVKGVDGLWSLRLSALDEAIRLRILPCHEYHQRKNHNSSNARYSWLIPLSLCVKRPKTEKGMT